MSEEGYTPETEYVRAVYAQYNDNHLEFIDRDYGAEFDLWLAKREQAAFDRGYAHGAEYGAVLRGMWPTH
jgi:hypothetical protein